MKKKKNSKDPWEGFPTELKYMMLSIFHSVGEYCVPEAIRYLLEHAISKDERDGFAKMHYLRWTDQFFCRLFPMFTFEAVWREYSDELEEILTHAYSYICDLAGDYDSIMNDHLSEVGYREYDLVSFAQRFEFYSTTLSWYQDEQELFEKGLNRLCEATKRNMRYVLSCENERAEELLALSYAGMSGMMELEFNKWEPLAWAFHEGGATEFTAEMIQAYEEYSAFLCELDCGANEYLRNSSLTKVEEDLQWLYKAEIDRLEDDCEDCQCHSECIEEYKRKIQDSELHVMMINKNTIDTSNVNEAFFDEEYEQFESEMKKIGDEVPF